MRCFQQNELRHILVRHEQGATHAAEGYARSTGKVGVVFVTSGPGRDECDYWPDGCIARFNSTCGYHRSGADAFDWLGCIPRGRHYWHHQKL